MPDILMTVCTYDDGAPAEEDLRKLLEAGLRAALRPCLYVDPENPDATLVDLVVFDQDLERAQDILRLFPPDPTEPDDPASFQRASRFARILVLALGVLAALFAIWGLLA